ncbi:MAG: phosphatase PAP2 family protein [Candidatus Zixiibacteriota bacterium]
MLDFLINIDTQIFYFVNLKLQNGLFDFLMVFLTKKSNWMIPLWIAWLVLFILGKKKGRIVALLLLVTIAVSDQVSAQLIKKWVGRIRPCNVLENVHLLVGCTQAFSFPSAHASNLFASATLLCRSYKSFTPVFLVIAFLVSFSRIYVGVHYPFDVLAGGILGFISASFVLFIFNFINTRTTILGRKKLLE